MGTERTIDKHQRGTELKQKGHRTHIGQPQKGHRRDTNGYRTGKNGNRRDIKLTSLSRYSASVNKCIKLRKKATLIMDGP